MATIEPASSANSGTILVDFGQDRRYLVRVDFATDEVRGWRLPADVPLWSGPHPQAEMAHEDEVEEGE